MVLEIGLRGYTGKACSVQVWGPSCVPPGAVSAMPGVCSGGLTVVVWHIQRCNHKRPCLNKVEGETPHLWLFSDSHTTLTHRNLHVCV